MILVETCPPITTIITCCCAKPTYRNKILSVAIKNGGISPFSGSVGQIKEEVYEADRIHAVC